MADNGSMAANDEGGRPGGEAARLKARDLNELIRYTMWSVFRVSDRAALDGGGSSPDPGHRTMIADEVTGLLEEAAGKGTVTRGCYDVQGLRADADYMLWWVAPSSDELQEMYTRFRRTRLGRASEPVWSVMALHRPAEFNKGHIPAFLAEEEPRSYVCVYPFVRSYDWYLLDPAERRTMLAEHGKMAREYPDVRANTVPSFALNDYEWILALRGRRAVPDCRPDAPPAGRRGPPAHQGGDPVLHRPPQAGPGTGRRPAVTVRRPAPARAGPGYPRSGILSHVADDLRVNGWLVIPAGELHERFSRSSGPGGQSVNTADTRVELSFDIAHSAALPEYARERALSQLAGRLTDGVLTVIASEQRSQLLNRRAARGRAGQPAPGGDRAAAAAPHSHPARPRRA